MLKWKYTFAICQVLLLLPGENKMKKEPMTIRIDLLLKMALTEISIKEKYKNVNNLIANILKESIAQKQKDGQLSEQLLAIDEKISVIYEAVKIMATK